MAEAILKHIFETDGAFSDNSCLSEVFSRGLNVYRGDTINPRAYLTLVEHGIPFDTDSFRSKLLRENELTDKSLILTMTERQKASILCMYTRTENVFTLHEFAGEQGEIPDPFSQPAAVYSACFDELSRLISKITASL